MGCRGRHLVSDTRRYEYILEYCTYLDVADEVDAINNGEWLGVVL